jgi:hypothetical protein
VGLGPIPNPTGGKAIIIITPFAREQGSWDSCPDHTKLFPSASDWEMVGDYVHK